MPHSSGGGGHGGGGHGGHGGHGGRGGSSARISRTSFAGAHRYVYYSNRKPQIIYADRKPDSDPFSLLMIFFAISFLITASSFLLGAIAVFVPAKKLNTRHVSTDIIIEDEAGVMTDTEEEELEESLEEFFDTTGIVPAVVTVNNEDWMDDYTNLERYSFHRYTEMFKDEKHWLIVYSEPEDPDEDFNDWYWEGMQGDDTDRILTTKKTDSFNKDLQKFLLNRDRYSVADAIAKAFDNLTPHIMTRVTKNDIGSVIILFLFVLFTLGPGILLLVLGIRGLKKYKTAFECKEEVVRQAKCNYCGGVYVVGHHSTCPHCQAQIPYEHSLAYANTTADVV